MISVDEALRLVAESCTVLGTEYVALPEATDRILAQDVYADRDFPPFDRVTMDGIAINSRAYDEGRISFQIERVQAAGSRQVALADTTHCIEVMTGAMIPKGTDAVIRYEDCTIQNGMATINSQSVKPYQNVHLRGVDSKGGALLLSMGQKISAAMTGVMATVGMEEVLVRRLPRMAVCSTGEELVDIGEMPEPHQIRKSNSYMLAAALRREGIEGTLYHLPDNKELMLPIIRGLKEQYDVLLFSGAVSKGKYDFLPEVLGELGMRTIFHNVAQKPGKPLLFGVFESGATVFGLPGNPVSTMVCYKIFFQKWLDASMEYERVQMSACLSTEVTFNAPLTYHMLVTLDYTDGMVHASPCGGANSGDMISLAAAQGIVTLPAEQSSFTAGSAYPLTLL